MHQFKMHQGVLLALPQLGIVNLWPFPVHCLLISSPVKTKQKVTWSQGIQY